MFYQEGHAVKDRNGREIALRIRAHVEESSERSKVPGVCSDCGNDAYIRLTGENGAAEMVCAHCFVDRARVGKLVAVKRSPARTDIRTGPLS
jgi:hypothetical protein